MDLYRSNVKVAEIRELGGKICLRYISRGIAPVSLSLPNTGEILCSQEVVNWLKGFLPEDEETLYNLQEVYGAREVVPLLRQIGRDVSGDLTFLPKESGTAIRNSSNSSLNYADIAAKISAIENKKPLRRAKRRFSLAGQQGKFSLSFHRNIWFEPDEYLPSTHIFKPAPKRLKVIENLESASLALANSIGVPAAKASVISVQGHTSFVTERFDRCMVNGVAVRIPQEDFSQALGKPPEDKYFVELEDMFRITNSFLRKGQNEILMRQLIFNTLIGNTDAHAKNYSINLSTRTITPMYDVIPVDLLPQFSKSLPLPICGIFFARELTVEHWKSLARMALLRPEEVMKEIFRQKSAIKQIAPCLFKAYGVPQELSSTLVNEVIESNTQSISDT